MQPLVEVVREVIEDPRKVTRLRFVSEIIREKLLTLNIIEVSVTSN